MPRCLALPIVAACLLGAHPAAALSLHVETSSPSIVAPGERVEFELYLDTRADEPVQGVQIGFDVSSLGPDFDHSPADRRVWSLISTIAGRGDDLDVLAVHAAQQPIPGGSRLPLGGFSALASSEGRIALLMDDWVIASGVPGVAGSDTPPVWVLDTGVCVSASGVCSGELPDWPPQAVLAPEPVPVPVPEPVAPAPEPLPLPEPDPELAGTLDELRRLDLIDGHRVLVTADGQILTWTSVMPRGRAFFDERRAVHEGGAVPGTLETPEPGGWWLLALAGLALRRRCRRISRSLRR